MAEEEEDFEVLDLSAARGANGYIQQILGDVSRQSVAKQVMIGGAAGWYSIAFSFSQVNIWMTCLFLVTIIVLPNNH
jgi:hypothetical protein